VLGDQVAQLADQLARSVAGRAGPGREGGLGGGHRGVDLVGAAGGHLGQHLLRGGVDGLE
jgi:hypothetical protein